MIFGRSSTALITSSTDPTSTARWMLWTASNSDATWPSFSARTADRVSAAAATSPARSAVTPGRPAPRPRGPLVRLGPRVDVAGEHHGRRRRATDHRGVRALDGEHRHPRVERLGEDHERPAVVPRDDGEHDRSLEVDDGPADLGAVLELQPAHRVRQASNPDRLASTTSGRLPLAALMARAAFFDDFGNSVPAV